MNHLESAHRSSCAMIPIGIAAAFVTMNACAEYQPPPAPPPTAMAAPAPERTGSTMMQPTGDSADRTPVPAPFVAESTENSPAETKLDSLDDAHLAALVQEVNDRAIRTARLGESRAIDREVKRFARDMATSHLDAQNKLRARLSVLGVESASSPASDQVHVDAGGSLATLQSAHGKAFDSAYVDEQLSQLTRAVELVDRVVANIRNPELRDAAEGVRSRLQANIRLARAVQQDVRTGTTNLRLDAFDPDKLRR
jgi:putative membrane protein